MCIFFELPEMKFAGWYCGVALMEQEMCEAQEGGTGNRVPSAALWEAAGKRIRALLAVIEVLGSRVHKAALCSAVGLPAAFYTAFANVGGCAQLLLSERLMGEQRSKQDLNAALAPCAFAAHRGKGCLEGTEKHKQIEILAWLCLPQ